MDDDDAQWYSDMEDPPVNPDIIEDNPGSEMDEDTPSLQISTITAAASSSEIAPTTFADHDSNRPTRQLTRMSSGQVVDQCLRDL